MRRVDIDVLRIDIVPVWTRGRVMGTLEEFNFMLIEVTFGFTFLNSYGNGVSGMQRVGWQWGFRGVGVFSA